jgi:hypothetical protein
MPDPPPDLSPQVSPLSGSPFARAWLAIIELKTSSVQARARSLESPTWGVVDSTIGKCYRIRMRLNPDKVRS